MLGISIDWLVLAKNSIEHAWRLFRIYFSFLPEVDASYPFVLYLFEWWFDFDNDC